MEDEASGQVRQASNGGGFELRRAADIRYQGQGETLEVELTGLAVSEFADHARRRFEDGYRELYGRSLAGQPVEVLNWHVSAAGSPRAFRGTDIDESLAYAGSVSAPSGMRWMIDPDTGEPTEARAYDRDSLRDAGVVVGPALILDAACTMIVGSRGTAEVGEDGAVRIRLL
jgi:N-methylhydantoinase A